MKRIFEKYDITYWLDYGTLWGAIRDNAVMEFDNDVDFGVLLKDVPKISQLKQEFKKEGYDLRINRGHLNYVVHKISTGEHLGCILFREAKGNYVIRIRFNPILKFILLPANYGKGGRVIKWLWKKIINGKFIDWYRDMEVSSTVQNLGRLKKYKFYGEDFPIPEHPEKYLDWMYCNRDWRIKSDGPLHGAEVGRRRQRLHEVL